MGPRWQPHNGLVCTLPCPWPASALYPQIPFHASQPPEKAKQSLISHGFGIWRPHVKYSKKKQSQLILKKDLKTLNSYVSQTPAWNKQVTIRINQSRSDLFCRFCLLFLFVPALQMLHLAASLLHFFMWTPFLRAVDFWLIKVHTKKRHPSKKFHKILSSL